MRAKIPGTQLLSESISIGADLHHARLAFQKHRPQLLQWQYPHPMQFAERRGAPQVRMKREWGQQGTRNLVLFSSFWIVNKTGMELRYRTFTKAKKFTSNETVLADDHPRQHHTSAAAVDDRSAYKLRTDCLTADSIYHDAFGKLVAQEMPILLDCPSKKLSVLPYAMKAAEKSLYVYDLQVKSPLPYRCLDNFAAGDSFRTDIYCTFEVFPSCLKGRDVVCIQTPSVDAAAHSAEELFLTFMVCTARELRNSQSSLWCHSYYFMY